MDDERLIAISLTQNVEQLHSIPQVARRKIPRNHPSNSVSVRPRNCPKSRHASR
jgi:hypothetical protein